MSVEENKAVLRRLYDRVNQGDLDVIDEVFSHNSFARHAPLAESPEHREIRDLEVFKRSVQESFARFTSIRETIEFMIGEDERIGTLVTVVATMPAGPSRQGAADETSTWQFLIFWRFEKQRIVEVWIK
jgi:hypothetical protein